jgi:acyl carrier protein
MTTIETEVLALVAAMSPDAGEPGLDDTFIGLGYTSLRFLELAIAVEQAFDLQPLRPESLAAVSTVRDLAELVRAQQDRP